MLGKISALDAQLVDRHLVGYGTEFSRFIPHRAEGMFLYDRNGKRMLDFTSGQMSAILGHSHPEIVEAICEGAKRLVHLYSVMLTCVKS